MKRQRVLRQGELLLKRGPNLAWHWHRFGLLAWQLGIGYKSRKRRNGLHVTYFFVSPEQEESLIGRFERGNHHTRPYDD